MELMKELTEFLDELEKYREVLTNPNSKLLEDKKKDDFFIGFPFLQEYLPKKTKEELIEEVRQDLVRKAGRYKDKIYKLTGKIYYTQFGQTREIWGEGLRRERIHTLSEPPSISVLDLCIDATNEAIGKLEEGGESWKVELPKKLEKVTKQPSKDITDKPKAFIAHGGKSEARDKLCQFLTALGAIPLIVEEQPSEGRSVGENVDYYARQADCAIILATKGDIDGKTGRFIPRGNVLIEIGKSQELFKDRIIYLLQAGAELPTNINEKVGVRFTSEKMDDAFIKIAKELTKFGILKAVKP